MRTLIIGDIHGCFTELSELIDIFNPKKNDRIVALGDVINKGPDSLNCLDLLQNLNAKVLMGNHEYWFLKYFQSSSMEWCFSPDLKEVSKSQLSYLKSFSYYLETDAYIAVHAGFYPNISLAENEVETLTNLRYIDKKPWCESYHGQKRVFFGHFAKLGLKFGNNYCCLDSGCVYGKYLSGYILEEEKLIQVKAKKQYQAIRKRS